MGQWIDTEPKKGIFRLPNTDTETEDKDEGDGTLPLDEEEQTEISTMVMKMPATTATKTTIDKAAGMAVEGSSGRAFIEVVKRKGGDLHHCRRRLLPRIRTTTTGENRATGKEEDRIVCLGEAGVEAILVRNRNAIGKNTIIREITSSMHDRIIITTTIIGISSTMRQFDRYPGLVW
jgi:hypothetical protein